MQAGTMALWIFLVYMFSFACYVPLGLQRLGVPVPDVLLYWRYGFVLMPALVSTVFLVLEHNGKNFLNSSFKKLSLKEIAACITAALTGIVITSCYSFAEKSDLFHSAYPSVLSLIISSGYLAMTALAVETAWRGFFFQRIAARGKVMTAAILTGVVWAVWHIPMWTIRNALSWMEIVPLFIWAVLISVVLGITFWRFNNLFSVSLLHMIFNVCFLAPTKYNNIL